MKLLLTILLVFTTTLAYAEINEKYSYQAYPYHELTFTHLSPDEFSNTTIRGTCFYQEAVYSADSLGNTPPESQVDIFPSGTENVTFINSNLDNIKLPKNSTLINCTNRRIRVQNSLDDWVLDRDSKPVEPMNKKARELAGESIDPGDIPNTMWTQAQYEEFRGRLRDAEISADIN